jgi:nitrogen fixation/metabolism regulation signal transduction histidine kinase
MHTKGKKLSKVDLETVIDNLLSAVIVVNRDSVILLVNKMAMFFGDKSREDLIGLRGGDAYNCVNARKNINGCGSEPNCKNCTIRNTVEETFRDKSNKSFRETSLTLQAIGKRDFRLSTTYLEEQDVVLLAMEDITDMKIMETENLEKSKLVAAINTAGAVCHEMNQPLQVISAHLDMFELKKRKNIPCDNTHFDAMRQQIERLAIITRKLQNIKRFASMSYTEGTDIMDLDKSTAA